MKTTGKLIVIEGLDGSGKSTQWELLKQSMKDVLFITFPDYESESGKIIKRYLSGEFDGETAYPASSFYAVDRYISYKTSWKSAFDGGANVISARYTSSNAIYQMPKLPESSWQEYLNWLYDYEHNKLGIPKPDLTIFLDVPIEISQELLRQRYADGSGEKDIHEDDVAYLEACRQAARYVSKRNHWRIVNCVGGCKNRGDLRTPEDINNELTTIIGDLLNA